MAYHLRDYAKSIFITMSHYFLIGSVVCLVSLSLSETLLGQRNLDRASINHVRLSNRLYVLESNNGNIVAMINKDGRCLLVDSPPAQLYPKYRDKLKSLGTRQITSIINTHWHAESVGFNDQIRESGGMIVAHENTRERMSTEQVLSEVMIPPARDEALPMITLTESMTIYNYDEPIMLLHVPRAHTDSDVIVWFPQSNVMVLGDCFLNGLYPFIDIEGGGSVEGLIRAIEMALLLIDEETKLVPAHGSIGNVDDLQEYLKFLRVIRDKIKKAILTRTKYEDISIVELVAGFEKWKWALVNGEQLKRNFYESLISEKKY